MGKATKWFRNLLCLPGKSKSSSSAKRRDEVMVAKRRDDDAIQSAMIQSAIMHCKRSFKAGNSTTEEQHSNAYPVPSPSYPKSDFADAYSKISASVSSDMQSMLGSLSSEGSGNLMNFTRTGHSMLGERPTQQSRVSKFAPSQVHTSASLSLPPYPGKDAVVEQESTSLDAQNQALFGSNIDSSGLLLPTTVSSRGTSTDGDIPSLSLGASGFQNSLYTCMQDSSELLHSSGHVDPLKPSGTFVKVYKSGSVGRSLDITRASLVYANRASVIYDGVSFSWLQTYQRCCHLASSLRSLNISKNDVVSVLAPNTPAMYEMHFAVPMAGAVLNAINTRLDAKNVATILRHSEAKMFFVDYEYVPIARDALRLLISEEYTSLPLVIVIDDIDSPTGIRLGELEYEQLVLHGNPGYVPEELEDEWDAIALNYTSGTTSDPKGVVYSHRGAFLSTMSLIQGWEMGTEPVYLWSLPMFHCNGWTFTWGVAARGGTNVCIRNTTAQEMYSAIAQHKVTHMCCAPIVFTILLEAKQEERCKINNQVNILTGGAPPPAPLLEKMEQLGFHVMHAYGSTEATGPALICEWQAKWNSLPREQQAKLKARQGDELLWAAAWLCQATKEDYYLKYVVDNAVSMGGTGWAVKQFSWDNKYAGVQILLSKVLLEGGGGAYTSTLKQYQAKADYFACACQQKNDGYNAPMTLGGLLYINDGNNLQYAASAAFLHAVYSEYLSAANAVLKCPDAQLKPRDLLNFAKSQADYILGKNPKSMSYLVGYGQNYPVHVHHRGASIASKANLHSPVGCVQGFETWYRRPDKNPNVIYGGLVGGPNKNDEFSDDRANYEQTEPTTSGTAPLLGLFSKLISTNGHPRAGSNHQETPTSYRNNPQSSNPKEAPMPNPRSSAFPVKFFHSKTNSWTDGGKNYYRHRVIVKNTSHKSAASVLFIWNEKTRPQTVMPSSVLSSDSKHIGLLAAAAHAAATNSCFTIFYNPRASPSEFVIPLSKYFKAVLHTRVSVGMRFRMLFETEESSVRRYMGTVTGIGDLDPVRWPNSHWRSVKVGWDESTAGDRQPRVSLWEIEPLTTFPMYPWYPGASSFQDSRDEAVNGMTWLRGETGEQGLNSLNFQSAGMIPWMQQRVDPTFARNDLNQQYQAMLRSGFQNVAGGDSLRQQFMQFQQPVQYLQAAGSHNPLLQQRVDPTFARNDLNQQYQAMLRAGFQNVAGGDSLRQQFMQFQQHVQYLQAAGSHNPLLQQQAIQQPNCYQRTFLDNCRNNLIPDHAQELFDGSCTRTLIRL